MNSTHVKKLSDISNDNVLSIHKIIHPFSSFLFPSIMHLWYNKNNNSISYTTNTYNLALLYPTNDRPFWSLSTRAELNKSDLIEIKHIVDSVHPASELRFSTISEVADIEDSSLFAIEPDDLSYYDYIYDVSDLEKCIGKKYEDTRRHIRKFYDVYGHAITTKTITNWEDLQSYKQQAYELFDDWTHSATEGSKDYQDEERAFKLFLDADKSELFGEIIVILFFYHDKLIGYSINEIYDKKYALNHFHKSNLNLSSIGHYTFYAVAVELGRNGVSFLNFQEDCGIGGLRMFKHKMRPSQVFETQKVTYLAQS